MKYKHYAPECDVVIADGGNDCKKPPPSPAVNTPAQSFRAKMHHTRNGTNQIPLFGKAACRYRRQDSTADAVRRPFRELRNESRGMDLIIAESVPAEAQGLAYMNRLLRAAGFTVISE